ncbi:MULTISPECIES: lipopolysaccharide assembly protein LapB [unclassified Paludibacterium]|uniref:tetratricopeptide repeat protein n=1 Tax=unclassified Paludibacterium TaxID=2618429 RepID=UPI001C048085|nr:hypothetical protein [Paludibacterium sp. B53371]BEV71943.1 hypothetical protein THUN1379_14250 [Paludibacterium sp. THUN1379]
MSELLIAARLRRAIPLLMPGILLQSYVLYRLLTAPMQTASSSWVVCMLLLQALAALLATPATLTLLPRRFKHRQALTGLFLWCYLFAVPIGGLLLTCGAIALASRLPAEPEDLPIELTWAPTFLAPQASTSFGRGAHLKSVLQSQGAASSFRMTALMAMQAMPMRTVSPLLRTMLDDQFEDIRLLAFWMLDRQEKELTQKILDQLPRLKLTLSKSERYRVNKELALLYNELVYSYLVQGDVYRHAAREADRYAAEALALMPGDASLWRLRGRLALDRGDTASATTMLDLAMVHGFERLRLLPYLAEVAYLDKDYAQVKALLAAQPLSSALPVMQPVIRYWSDQP